MPVHRPFTARNVDRGTRRARKKGELLGFGQVSVVIYTGVAPAQIYLGSCLHALVALKEPRWEDFNYQRSDGSKNRLRWLGNGMSYNEQHMIGDSECMVSHLPLVI